MTSCCCCEEEFNRVNYLRSVGGLEAVTGVCLYVPLCVCALTCVCLGSESGISPLFVTRWGGEMMHMPACLCLHAAPCGQKSKFEDTQCYLCLSVWFVIWKKAKTNRHSQQWIRAPYLTSVVFRSQALQPPEQTALAVACCLLSSGEHRPASVCRRRMSQQGEILNPLKSADQRQWQGWRRALDGGRSRSCLLAF